MGFLSIEIIQCALAELALVHTFFGTTFLVFKQGELPIGELDEFSIDSREKDFFETYYKPAPDSKWYYRVFRTSDRNKRWLDAKFPSSGSQSTRTRGDIAAALLHEKDTILWGWDPNYIVTLKSKLYRKKPVPAFPLAVWLFRDRAWSDNTTIKTIIDTFLREFKITPEEMDELFDLELPECVEQVPLFQVDRVSWKQLRQVTGDPPDALREDGNTLRYLELQGTGTARQLIFEPSQRINLITGDNGLGKTFILECAWWALSGFWTGSQAIPQDNAKKPLITFQISDTPEGRTEMEFDFSLQHWELSARERRKKKSRPTIPGLLLYARVDGSFAVWDSSINTSTNVNSHYLESNQSEFIFTSDDVWYGKEDTRTRKRYINGLVDDWTTWQFSRSKTTFAQFIRVLSVLTSEEMGKIEPDDPMTMPPDTRNIPTLRFPYGRVPIPLVAAGMKRTMSLAYLIVWLWNEHLTRSERMRIPPQNRMVILIDEIEAHLHPTWQRSILPALTETWYEIAENLQVQYLITTHSPLVMTSFEPLYTELIDKIFHLRLVERNLLEKEVILEPIPFVKQGDADNWLTSEVFGLKTSKNEEAEKALKRARELQEKDENGEAIKSEEVEAANNDLVRHLDANDSFWIGWTFFANNHGVEI